jgi:Anti-sigma-K factor rskA
VWHPGAEQLALSALPAEVRNPEIDAHLAVCSPCREEVEALGCTVATAQAAGSGYSPTAPPARVWRAIAADLGEELGPDCPAAPDEAVQARSGRQWSGFDRTPWRRWVLTPASAAAGLIIGLLIGFASTGAPPAATVARAPLTPLATTEPGASGSAEVVDAGGARQVMVTVVDPAGIPPGAYLEAWLMDAAGTRLYPLGALTPQPDGVRFRGTFELPADLPLGQYDTVDVSAEPLDGDPSHSGASLLRGRTI